MPSSSAGPTPGYARNWRPGAWWTGCPPSPAQCSRSEIYGTNQGAAIDRLYEAHRQRVDAIVMNPGDAIAGGVSGRAETVLLPGCGHVPHHEVRQPALRRMAGFVATLAE